MSYHISDSEYDCKVVVQRLMQLPWWFVQLIHGAAVVVYSAESEHKAWV